MAYKWKPSKSQKKAFAQRMQDPTERAEYENRKEIRAQKRRASSKFDYNTAGGYYVPTKEQSVFAFKNIHLFDTPKRKEAANMVISGYALNDKVHHDYIHIVNEIMRSNTHLGYANEEAEKMTVQNVLTDFQKYNLTDFPERIQKAWVAVEKSHKFYDKSETIKKMVDEFVSQVNDSIKEFSLKPQGHSEAKSKPKTETKEKPKTDPQPKIKVTFIGKDDWSRKLYKNVETGELYADVDGTLHYITKEGEPLYPVKKKIEIVKEKKPKATKEKKEKPSKPTPNAVHHIEPEVKFIRRYANMNGTNDAEKAKTFLRTLQKAIVDKTITKLSKYATEVMEVQRGLIHSINNGTKIAIPEDRLNHYKTIGSGQMVFESVAILKQYVAIQGKTNVKDKAEKLLARIEKAEKKGVIEVEPFSSEVTEAKSTLKKYINGSAKTIVVPDLTLQGLYGLLGIK